MNLSNIKADELTNYHHELNKKTQANYRIWCAVEYAKTMLGVPYIWGGNNPLEGLDCSGYVQCILASVGLDPHGDQTAGMLYRHFKTKKAPKVECSEGALAFYGGRDRIIHIAYCINDFQVIEAGGGGRKCRTKEDAAREGAFVRIRPYNHRDDFMCCLMPDYL